MSRKPKGTTVAGFVNRNSQMNRGKIEPPILGTDKNQYVYRLQCERCSTEYGANGSDIHCRLCPNCQGGRPGLSLKPESS